MTSDTAHPHELPNYGHTQAINRFNPNKRTMYRVYGMPLRATRAQAEADYHFPHDYDSTGRCRVKDCNLFDPTEGDEIRDGQ